MYVRISEKHPHDGQLCLVYGEKCIPIVCHYVIKKDKFPAHWITEEGVGLELLDTDYWMPCPAPK